VTECRYGRLTVVGAEGRTKDLVLCQCDCGTTGRWVLGNLRSGNTTSCGCAQREGATARCLARTKHGHSRRAGETPEYVVWQNMLRRCFDPTNKRWGRYGGRGITVHPGWQTSFASFLSDVGPRPSSAHTLDRIDNDGHYEPSNVRWVTPEQQARNKSSTRWIEAFEERLPLVVWAQRTGLERSLISYRLRVGWSPERALTERPRGRK
jgi:hypothetical protein